VVTPTPNRWQQNIAAGAAFSSLLPAAFDKDLGQLWAGAADRQAEPRRPRSSAIDPARKEFIAVSHPFPHKTPKEWGTPPQCFRAGSITSRRVSHVTSGS